MAEPPAGETKIETTSAVVENATRIERTSIHAENQTGRTLWDAIVDLARLMGPYAPWVIMIAGAIFAFYKFTQLQETAQDKAREQVQKELDAAHKELRDTYNQIADMNKQELGNVKSMLEVHELTVKSTEDQRKKYNDLREQSNREREQVEKSRQEADQAKVEANNAIKNAQDASKSASDAAAKIEKAEKELAAKESELNRKSEEVNKRATKIGDLNQKLIELATAMLSPSSESVTRELATNILRDYSPEPKSLLKAFADQPSESSAKMLKNLIGKGTKELIAGLKEGLGFSFWQKVSRAGKGDEAPTYLGVVRQTDNANENVVLLNTHKEKIVEVYAFQKVIVVSAPDTQNWNQPANYLLYRSVSSTERSGVDSYASREKTWTLVQGLEGTQAEPIFGVERELAITNIADLKTIDAETLDIAKLDTTSDFAEALSMLSNAEHFKPADIVGARVEPKEVRDILVDLLTAGVEHKTAVPRLRLGNGLKLDVFGRFAAAALKPSFALVSISKFNYRNPSTAEAPQGYSIICQYFTVLKQMKRNRITLTHDSSADEWILTTYDDPYVLPTTSLNDSSTDQSSYEYGQDYGYNDAPLKTPKPTSSPRATKPPTPSPPAKPSVSPRSAATAKPSPRKTP